MDVYLGAGAGAATGSTISFLGGALGVNFGLGFPTEGQSACKDSDN